VGWGRRKQRARRHREATFPKTVNTPCPGTAGKYRASRVARTLGLSNDSDGDGQQGKGNDGLVGDGHLNYDSSAGRIVEGGKDNHRARDKRTKLVTVLSSGQTG
jgi:hypothetical protein